MIEYSGIVNNVLYVVVKNLSEWDDIFFLCKLVLDDILVKEKNEFLEK